MARPRKEGMDYFPHDTDAANDEKVDSMRALYGNDGYAFFFVLCERIYRTSNAELDISKPVLLTPIIKKLLVTPEKFEDMLEAAFELNLFDPVAHSTRKVLTSNGIKKRFKEVSQMRNRWRKHKENDEETGVIHEENPVDNHADNIAEKPEETRESKVKQSKVNKTKEKESEEKKEYADYVFLTETEYGKLTELLGDEDRDRFFLRFASWLSGQTKRVQASRSAYLTILNWFREDAKKQIPFPRQQQSKYERTKSKLEQMLREAEGKENEQSGYYQTGTDTFG